MGDAPPPGPRPLAGDIDADVVIVGGGYTGLWTAIAVKSRDSGARVCLLEAGRCGAGPSGRNGGFLHGWTTQLAQALPVFGPARAVALARQGARAQQEIVDFCARESHDVWLRHGGLLRIATTQRQLPGIKRIADTAAQLGLGHDAVYLDAAQTRARCDSPRFLDGVFVPSAGTLHPMRLLLLLRAVASRMGVEIYEESPARVARHAHGVQAIAPGGRVTAHAAVIATGAQLAAGRAVRPFVTNFSSYMVATEPVPELLARLGWEGGEGLNDGRMFLHYFRTTPDGRIVFGFGGGPIGYSGRVGNALTDSAKAIARAERGLRRLLPQAAAVKIEYGWGGPIDISADGFPFVRRSSTAPIYLAGGFSGHGVNPTYIAGQALASLCLGRSDDWTQGPLCREVGSRFPPEPLRYIGAAAVRSAILAVEDADDEGRRAPAVARVGAAVPRLLKLRLGTR
jgi:glycine/D-amino acid oxidase-like deaminating enzyme